jgi:hypothetical protein
MHANIKATQTTPATIAEVGPGMPIPVIAIGGPMGEESGSRSGGRWARSQRSKALSSTNPRKQEWVNDPAAWSRRGE